MSESANAKSLIVIAETNFILDIVFEQSEQADRLFTLALNGIEIFFSSGDCIRRIREILGI